jgi:hypothetical protein
MSSNEMVNIYLLRNNGLLPCSDIPLLPAGQIGQNISDGGSYPPGISNGFNKNGKKGNLTFLVFAQFCTTIFNATKWCL